MRCRELDVVLQVEDHASHSRNILRDAHSLQQLVADLFDRDAFFSQMGARALQIEENAVRIGDPVRLVSEFTVGFDRYPGDIGE